MLRTPAFTTLAMGNNLRDHDLKKKKMILADGYQYGISCGAKQKTDDKQ